MMELDILIVALLILGLIFIAWTQDNIEAKIDLIMEALEEEESE